jgi:hypothetical protein
MNLIPDILRITFVWLIFGTITAAAIVLVKLAIYVGL